MKETMGQIIRKLRKERNMTQEELAEQIGVTFQAISKWENNAGMPDISQIVPLATVFHVSTDVLFGIRDANNAKEVQSILDCAYSKLTSPSTKESTKQWYDELQKGLEKYPNNIMLLSSSLEAGISLAYPENDVFDAEHGEEIYKECIRQANIVIKYGENTTDILRAHMIMVLLHAAYGNLEMAKSHANEFPWRADMTVHKMKAYISHFLKDDQAESVCCQADFLYHFHALLDIIVQLGCCYCSLESYEKAEYTFMQALSIIELIFGEQATPPRFHKREHGDIYSLLAELYLRQGRHDEALSVLKKMVDYDINEINGLPKDEDERKIKTPLLGNINYDFYQTRGNQKEILLKKLSHPAFETLKDTEEFAKLMSRATAL